MYIRGFDRGGGAAQTEGGGCGRQDGQTGGLTMAIATTGTDGTAATDHGHRCRTTGRGATVRRNPSANRSTSPRTGVTTSSRGVAAVARSAHRAVATNVRASR